MEPSEKFSCVKKVYYALGVVEDTWHTRVLYLQTGLGDHGCLALPDMTNKDDQPMVLDR